MKKEITIGFFSGIIATAVGLFLYLQLFFSGEFENSLQRILEEGLFGKVISLAAIANLIVFFIFIKKNKDYRARGVLLATIVIAALTMIFKFL